jgi:hypothetical protein
MEDIMPKDPIELRTQLALDGARSKNSQQERAKARIEAEIAFGRKPALSPFDKFLQIKPTGSRDGYGP